MNIKELKIFTQNVSKQADFYSKVLGFIVKNKSENAVSFKAGSSILTFIEKQGAKPYHFAFNIPSNQEHEALSWVKSRVEILKDNTNEIIDFASWNAKAIYFYDTDKNIVEFIARKNLDNASNQPFDQNSIIEISEIGVPTKNIKEIYNTVNAGLGLEVYDGNFDVFCAIGNENGLFICVNKNKKTWYPIGDTVFLNDFEAIVEVGDTLYKVRCQKGTIKVANHTL